MNRIRVLGLVSLIVGILVWGAGRIATRPPVAYPLAWMSGEQILPVSLPRIRIGATSIPEDPGERSAWLSSHSVDWNEREPDLPWRIYVLASRFHAAVLYASDAEIDRLTDGSLGLERLPAGEWLEARIEPAALANDRDGDGDPLDAGEVTSESDGVSVFIIRTASPSTSG